MHWPFNNSAPDRRHSMATLSVTVRVSSLLLLLSALMSISTTLEATEAGDEAALVAFKAAAVRGGGAGALASWNGSGVAGGFCSWEGVTCGRRRRRVVALSLPSRGLTGVLSPAIGNLSFLRTIQLQFNGFSGDIPASLGRLRRLEVLNLSRNAFSGELPTNLSFCAGLEHLILTWNQLQGRVPSELGNKLLGLKVISLGNNSLTGPIPESLANLSSLRILDLMVNQLQGTIPPGLGGIPGIQYLGLAQNNLTGEPPRKMYNLSSLRVLEIQGNMLHGGIPADTGSRFPNMEILMLNGNQFTGSIPASLSNLTALKVLSLTQNKFSGYVPRTLGNRLQGLHLLDLGFNGLKADDREGWEFITSLSNCTQLEELMLSKNPDITGQLPPSIANLSKTLHALGLEGTGISGSIPSAIGNLVNLRSFNVMHTSIAGVIPESIGRLRNLGMLDLSYTGLSGIIPSSIGNLSKLTNLYAIDCNLEGAIPASLGKMENLVLLDLSLNILNGSIPREIFKLPALSFSLDLSYNSLSGPLPSEVGSLQNLNQLFLSGNQLSGKIPDSIGECTVLQELWLGINSFEGSIPQSLSNIKGLRVLNLFRNRLSGSIPNFIASIPNLQLLFLAHNNLSGPIPTLLQNLTSLLELDLSFNNLQGEVPKEGIFKNLSYMSVAGNSELCGGIPELHLAPCQENFVKNNRKGRLKPFAIALATIGALLFLALFIALIQLIYKKLIRHKQKRPLQPTTGEEQYARVSYHALAIGTNGFSQANLLGKGSFGMVYKCTFQDEPNIFAVKVFNLEQSGSNRSFVAECEALRRLRHRCLVKVITCCSSINHKGQEFKALIFELMPNGSLNSWLHQRTGMPTTRNTLSLVQRLDIAVDIMDALDYLHNHCEPPIIHCDLKPSNILLTEDMSARVGDFGISKILPGSASRFSENSNRTIGIRGTIGYVAPEYGEGSSASALGDVYSLGILLLEMFTGKSPTDDMFGGFLDLHSFSESALPGRIWEIVDTTMWLHQDIYDSAARSRVENCLTSVIALGVCCSKKQPRERALIQDAVAKMHAIRNSYLKFSRPLVPENGVAI